MNHDEFMEMVQRPEFGDSLEFVIERAEVSERTFSLAALEAVAQQMTVFMVGRTAVRWDQTGEPPQAVTATISLEWGEPVGDSRHPWFKIGDQG